MKFVFAFFLLVGISVMGMPDMAHAAENKTVTLEVPGMTCGVCPITVRKALEKVPGVSKAQADFDSKTATVTFDPDKTNTEALLKATANAGYPASLKK